MSNISLQPDSITRALNTELVIVIPVYNEADNIRQVVADWVAVLEELGIAYQFILLNDGSSDATLEVLKQMESEAPERLVIVDKPNSGHGRSCRLGYSAAAASQATQWVLQIDSDGQCDPVYFRQFWEKRHQADCVFGIRKSRDDGWARVIMSRTCRIATSLVIGVNLEDPNVPYRMIRREVLAAALANIPAAFDIHNVAITSVLRCALGVRWEFVPIRFLDRQGGCNSINLLNVAHLGTSMLFDLWKLRKKLRQPLILR